MVISVMSTHSMGRHDTIPSPLVNITPYPSFMHYVANISCCTKCSIIGKIQHLLKYLFIGNFPGGNDEAASKTFPPCIFCGGTKTGSFSYQHSSFQPQLHSLMWHRSSRTTVIFSPDKQNECSHYFKFRT